MKLRKSPIATLAALACISAAGASVPDHADHRQYYNLHLRLVHGVRSGQVLAEEDHASAGRAAAGAPAARPAGLQSASSRTQDSGLRMDPARGSGRRGGGDEALTRQEMEAGSHD